jgi:transposase
LLPDANHIPRRVAVIARRQTGHGSGLGRHRWVVERTFAWLHNRRRLLIRTDRRDATNE